MKLLKFDSLECIFNVNFIDMTANNSASKLSLIAIVSFMVFFMSSCNNGIKTGYIDINEINKTYSLAKAYEKQIKAIENNAASNLLGIQATINLMEDSLKFMGRKNASQNFLKRLYEQKYLFEVSKKEQMAQVQDSIVFYRDKLNSVINTKVFEYGKINGFDYIFSPAGTSSFMYADNALNITPQVIKHLEQK